MYLLEDLSNRPEYETIPQWFWSIIPTQCPDCGMPMAINLNLTKLRCSDPRCPSKVVMRTVHLMEDLGIKGIADSGIRKFIDEYEMPTPFGVFALVEEGANAPLYPGVNAALDERIKAELKQVQLRGARLSTIVQWMHIPDISEKRSRMLFDEYASMKDFYDDMSNDPAPVEFIQEKLGIQFNDTVSLTALNVYNSLVEFEEDLFDAEDTFGKEHILPPLSAEASSKTLHGVYTDKKPTSLAKTKKEFYRLVEDSLPAVQIVWDSSVTKDTSFLITGTGKPTSKLVKARKLGIPVFEDEETLMDWLAEDN